MEIQFQCTFGDYQEALAAQRVKSRPRKTLLAFAVLLVLLLGIFVLISLRLTLAQSTVAMLAGSFIVAKLLSVASSFQFSRWLRRDFLNHPSFSRETSARIDDGGLYLEGENSNSYTKWPAFVRYQETRNLILLYVGARMFHAIPKRALSAERLAEFRNIVSSRIPTEAPTSGQRDECAESAS